MDQVLAKALFAVLMPGYGVMVQDDSTGEQWVMVREDQELNVYKFNEHPISEQFEFEDNQMIEVTLT